MLEVLSLSLLPAVWRLWLTRRCFRLLTHDVVCVLLAASLIIIDRGPERAVRHGARLHFLTFSHGQRIHSIAVAMGI